MGSGKEETNKVKSRSRRMGVAFSVTAIILAMIMPSVANALPSQDAISASPTIEQTMNNSISSAKERANALNRTLISETIPFKHVLNVADAQNVIGDAIPTAGNDIAISGVEYRQDNIFGQFIPDDTHSFSWFSNYFKSVHKSEPELYGLVVGVSDDSQSAGDSGVKGTLSNQTDASSNPSLRKLESKIASLSVQAPVFNAPKAISSDEKGDAIVPSSPSPASTNVSSSAVATANDWAASRLQLTLLRQTGSSIINSDSIWYPAEGRNIRNMPDDWTLEFDFKSYASNKLDSDTKWHTVNNTEECGITNAGGFFPKTQGQYFQQRNAVVSEVDVQTGTSGDIEPYFDNLNYSDSCEALDTTMGIGKPKNVSGSTPRVKTSIITDEGATPNGKNNFIFYYQAVSNDCLFGAATASCTGLEFNRILPGCNSETGGKCDKIRYGFSKGQYQTPGVWAWRATQPWSAGDAAAAKGPCSGWQTYPYTLKCPA